MGRKIAIIGAGNLGQAMAAHLSLEGHQVSIYNRTPSRIDEIHQRGGIQVEGVLEGLARIEVASSDPADVIPGRDLVMFTVPASSHRVVATNCAPYLEDGQALVLHPGHTLGALDVFNALKKAGVHRDLTFAEIQTSLLTSRRCGPAQVLVSAIKNALPIGVFPADHGFHRVEVLFDVYPSSIRAPDVLKTGLDNLNAPIHLPTTILNLARIDRGDDFLYYCEGMTPAVSRLVESVDAERCAVARALGVTPITALEFYRTAYDTPGDELWEKIQGNEAYADIKAPTSLRTRTIFEDVPTGLVPFSSLGDEVCVPTPTCDALIELTSVIFEVDFRAEGRTMENLGLTGLGGEGLKRFVRTGKR